MYNVNQIYLKRLNLIRVTLVCTYVHNTTKDDWGHFEVYIETTRIRERNEVVLWKKKTDSGNEIISSVFVAPYKLKIPIYKKLLLNKLKKHSAVSQKIQPAKGNKIDLSKSFLSA